MEASEKIYINKHPFTGEIHDKWLRNKWDDSDIEYVRKDAFIEKACEFISRRVFNCAEGSIIEDFKKYMKEE